MSNKNSESNEHSDKFTLSVRLKHNEANLSEFAKELQLRISRAWQAGDAIVGRNGIPTGSRRVNSYISSRVLTAQNSSSFVTSLETSIENLQRHEKRIREFINDGGTIELFVGWFFEGNSGVEIQATTLRQIGNLGLVLSIAAYGERTAAASLAQ